MTDLSRKEVEDWYRNQDPCCNGETRMDARLAQTLFAVWDKLNQAEAKLAKAHEPSYAPHPEHPLSDRERELEAKLAEYRNALEIEHSCNWCLHSDDCTIRCENTVVCQEFERQTKGR